MLLANKKSSVASNVTREQYTRMTKKRFTVNLSKLILHRTILSACDELWTANTFVKIKSIVYKHLCNFFSLYIFVLICSCPIEMTSDL